MADSGKQTQSVHSDVIHGKNCRYWGLGMIASLCNGEAVRTTDEWIEELKFNENEVHQIKYFLFNSTSLSPSWKVRLWSSELMRDHQMIPMVPRYCSFRYSRTSEQGSVPYRWLACCQQSFQDKRSLSVPWGKLVWAGFRKTCIWVSPVAFART